VLEQLNGWHSMQDGFMQLSDSSIRQVEGVGDEVATSVMQAHHDPEFLAEIRLLRKRASPQLQSTNQKA
jgi:hypothetical protein